MTRFFRNWFPKNLVMHFVRDYCSTIKACDQRPLENRVASFVHLLERSRFFLHFLVVPPSLDERFQDATHYPDAPCAKMVPQLGNGEAVGRAARTVERLRGDVVLHHDARIQGGKIELVEA